MQIKISKHDLSKALNTVTPTIGKGTGDDLTSHFVFRVGEDFEILSNSGTIWSGVRVSAAQYEQPEVDIQFTVEAHRLNQWVRVVKATSTIEMEYDDDTKMVRVEDDRGAQHFRSLDPEDFPFWDSMLSKAKTTATVRADHFRDALNYVKPYVLDDLQKQPQYCVAEVKDGNLMSCDGGALSVARINGLEEAGIRITGPHIGAISKFLDLHGESEVEIRESDRAYFIVAGNAVLGESRFSANFPNLNAQWDEEYPYSWAMQADEVKEVVLWLTAGTARDENRIYFEFEEGGEFLRMSMTALTGRRVSLRVRTIEYEEADEAVQIPSGGAGIPYNYLKNFIEKKGEESVFFALVPKEEERAGKKFVSRGTFLTKEENESGKFMTTAIWDV